MKATIKIKNAYLALISFSCFFLIEGCAKNFDALNKDPNAATNNTVQYESVFSQIELSTSGNSDGYTYEDELANLGYCSLMIQHFASTFYPGDKYGYSDQALSSYWVRQYSNPIKNNIDLIYNVKNRPQEINLYNIARIFNVFMFQRMTDLYGDIPFSQAGQGFNGNIQFPKYDTQQSIYMTMLAQLDSAATALDTNSANTLMSSDIIYGGSITAWQKFAYSEMARIAMRMANVDPTDAQKWIQIAYNGGAMTSNSDNAIVQHQDNSSNDPTTNGSGFVLITQDNGNFQMSQTFINFFKSHNDPRLRYYSTKCESPLILYGDNAFDYGDTTAAVQIGMPNGYDPVGGQVPISSAPGFPGNISKYSVPNRYTFASAAAPTFFLTAAETQLLFAEAAQRGWLTNAGTASSLYVNAVKLAFTQLIQTGADWSNGNALSSAKAYLKQNPYNSATGIQQINEQYWVTVFMDEYEAFANWRRSGFPVLTPVNYPSATVNVTGGTIPRRFAYPLAEVSINTVNYNVAVGRLSGGDKLTSRMWWDTRSNP